MHNEGYSTMCGHGVIAATTIAIERGLLVPREQAGAGPDSETPRTSGREQELALDSPAGTIQARARVLQQGDRRHVDAVAVTNVPSLVYAAGQTVKVGGLLELRV